MFYYFDLLESFYLKKIITESLNKNKVHMCVSFSSKENTFKKLSDRH
jgi:hypothetical protein